MFYSLFYLYLLPIQVCSNFFFSNYLKNLEGLAQNDFFGKTKEEIENFAKTQYNFTSILGLSIDSVKFLLYTNNSNEPLVLTEANATEGINANFESFFIIHGWLSSGTKPWVKKLAKNLHKVGRFNVIAVDWSILALADYFGAVRHISAVGYRIKDFIESKNITTNTTQIIGHSLGGQVASFVAKGLGQNKVKQIVGLDPAGPLFDWPIILPQQYRLSSEDATTVQVIHTSKFVRGVTITCGTIDFYVNGGTNQPGCPVFNTGNNFLKKFFQKKFFLLSYLQPPIEPYLLHIDHYRKTQISRNKILSFRCFWM